MRLRQSLVICGLALTLASCATQPALPPSATVADVAKAMKDLSPRDPIYQSLLDRLADPTRTPQTVESEYNRAQALFNRARAFERLMPPDWVAANIDYNRVVAEYEQNPDAVIDLIVSASILNSATNLTKIDSRRLPEALDGYNRALARVQETRGTKAQEIAAFAFNNMNQDLLQGTPEQHKQGLAGLETFTQRYRTSPSPEVRERVVSALVTLADAAQDNPAKLIAFSDEALTLVPQLAPETQERWKADATLKKTLGLLKSGKNGEFLNLSRSLVEANYNSPNVLQRRIAARAALNILVYQRDTLPVKLSDIEETNQDIQAKFGKETDNSIRSFALQSLLVFGTTHASTPKYIEAFQEMERRLDQDPTISIEDDNIAMLQGLARMNALIKNENRVIEYLRKFDALIEKIKISSQNQVQINKNLSEIYATQINLFALLGEKHQNKIAPLVNKMEQDFAQSEDIDVIENMLWANANQVSAFMNVSPNATSSALAFIDPMIQRYGNRPEPKIAGVIAQAYVNRIVLYSKFQPPRNNGILEDSDLVVSRYQGSQTPALRAQVAKALALRSGALERNDRPGAIQTLEKLIALYGGDSDPRVVEWVTKAREALRRLTLPATPAPVTPLL